MIRAADVAPCGIRLPRSWDDRLKRDERSSAVALTISLQEYTTVLRDAGRSHSCCGAGGGTRVSGRRAQREGQWISTRLELNCVGVEKWVGPSGCNVGMGGLRNVERRTDVLYRRSYLRLLTTRPNTLGGPRAKVAGARWYLSSREASFRRVGDLVAVKQGERCVSCSHPEARRNSGQNITV